MTPKVRINSAVFGSASKRQLASQLEYSGVVCEFLTFSSAKFARRQASRTFEAHMHTDGEPVKHLESKKDNT